MVDVLPKVVGALAQKNILPISYESFAKWDLIIETDFVFLKSISEMILSVFWKVSAGLSVALRVMTLLTQLLQPLIMMSLPLCG